MNNETKAQMYEAQAKLLRKREKLPKQESKKQKVVPIKPA